MAHSNGLTFQSGTDSGLTPLQSAISPPPFHHPPLTHPPDPETRLTSKQYFKLIQAIHHKTIMDKASQTNTFPPGMLRQVKKLTDFIRPSAPTAETRTKIYNNTTQWMLNTITILGQHYTHTIDSISTGPYNNLAFHIATGWARKRYGSRLSSGTLTTAHRTLGSTVTTTSSNPPVTLSNMDFPPLPEAQAPHKLQHFAGPSLTPTTQPGSSRNALLPSYYPVHNTLRSTPQIPELLPTPSIRRGPIKPPPYHPPPTSTNPTPLLQRNRKMSRGPTSNKDGPRPTEPIKPIQQIPLPQLTTLSSQIQKPPSGSVLTLPSLIQVHQPPSRTPPIPTPNPNPQPIPSHIFSNVAVHLTDDIIPFSQQSIALECPAGSQSPPQSITMQGDEVKNMMRGNIKVNHDQKLTHSETSTTQSGGSLWPTVASGASSVSPLRTSLSSGPPLLTNTIFQASSPHPLRSIPFLQAPSPPGLTTSSPLHLSLEHTVPTPSAPLLVLTSSSPSASSTGNTSSAPTSPPIPTSLSPTHRGSSPHFAPQATTTDQPICLEPGTSSSPILPPSADSAPMTIPHSPPKSSPKLYKPTIHPSRPNRKVQDWFFKPKKPVLILGDSNIKRIPPHCYEQIQLDSYPGANAYHFLKICEKTPSYPQVKIVIFSVGINNKDQDPRQTTLKQLKSLFRLSRSTFPNADIYFPVMNFSTNLTSSQKYNLKLVNNTMVNTFPCLLEIPHDTFHTETDNIHWTPSTAKLIFDNWLEQLNLQ